MRKELSPALLVADSVKWYVLPLMKGVASEVGSTAIQRIVEHGGGVVRGSGLKDKMSSS